VFVVGREQSGIRLREGSFHENPCGFALAQRKLSASNTNDQGISERGGVSDGYFFTGSKPEIEEPFTIQFRSNESPDS
jgi:hypothetical protein